MPETADNLCLLFDCVLNQEKHKLETINEFTGFQSRTKNFRENLTLQLKKTYICSKSFL